MNKTSDSKNYKDLNAELSEVLARLEDNEPNIDQLIKDYERGQQLIEEMEKYLEGAKVKITKLKTGHAK